MIKDIIHMLEEKSVYISQEIGGLTENIRAYTSVFKFPGDDYLCIVDQVYVVRTPEGHPTPHVESSIDYLTTL